MTEVKKVGEAGGKCDPLNSGFGLKFYEWLISPFKKTPNSIMYAKLKKKLIIDWILSCSQRRFMSLIS